MAGQIADLTDALNPDLTKRFPEEEDRKLAARFLVDLLKGTLPGVAPHQNGIRISGATFTGPVDLRNAQIPFEVVLESCVFRGPAHFGRASIVRTASFDQCVFKAAASFDGAKFGTAAFFRRATFQGITVFAFADVGGNFDADEAVFEGDALFHSMKVHQSAFFEKAIFNGLVNFDSAEVGAQFQANYAQFRNREATARLGMKCEKTASFEDTVFEGPVSFADSAFRDLTIINAATVPYIDLSRSSIKRLLNIKNVRVGIFEATGLQVDGLANFANLIVEKSARLSDARFVTLDLSGSVWPTNGKDGGVLKMFGMTYKYIRAHGDDDKSHKKLLKLADQSAYSPDIYENLEKYFLRLGYRRDADNAFVAGRRREREYLRGISSFGNWLGHVLTDYGRHPGRAGIPCAFFVALGCLLFAPRKMELQKPAGAERVYNRFWYSLGLFLPVVNLQSDGVWKPKSDQRFLRHYLRIHVLLGWILMPIFLAALTGLIK